MPKPKGFQLKVMMYVLEDGEIVDDQKIILILNHENLLELKKALDAAEVYHATNPNQSYDVYSAEEHHA